MKVLKYSLCTKVNRGSEDDPQIEEILSPVTMGWNEANEEIAGLEAHNGIYTVEDDGRAEPEAQPSDSERIAELEEALSMILNGVTE